MTPHTDVGYAQKGGSDPGCEPRAFGLEGVPWPTYLKWVVEG